MLEPSIVPVSSQSGDSGPQQGSLMRRIVMGNGFVSVLAVIVALFLGGLLIASTDAQVAKTAGYLFARPTDFLSALWSAMTESYVALFQGSVFNPRQGLQPLLETMTVATPADLRRSWRCLGLPCRPVQHRRPGPDHHQRHACCLRRVRLAPAVRPALAGGHHHGRPGWCSLGCHCGHPQSTDRRA